MNDRDISHLPHPIADRFQQLPNDWQVVRLQSLIREDSPICYGILMPGDNHEGGIPVVKVKNFNGGKIDLGSLLRTSPEIEKPFSRSRLLEGDLLLSIRGSVGQVAIACRALANANITQDTARIRINDSVCRDYLFHTLLSSLVQRQIDLNTVGQAVRGINISEVRRLAVGLPKIAEQRRIASILSAWGRSIDIIEKLVGYKQKQKQALMQQLLTGNIRLQSFAKRKAKNPSHVISVPAAVRRGIYPPSVQPGIPKLIEKPDGWDEKTMAELLKTKNRRVQLDDDTEYDLVVAKRNRGGIEPRGKLSGKEIRTSTQFKVKTGDFVISRRQIIHGACGIVPKSLDGAIVSNEYSVFTVNEHLDPGYLRLLSHSLYFQQTCFHSSVGVAVEKMIFKVDKWLKYPFVLPPIEEQRAIVKVLETAEREILLLRRRVDLLKQQKKGLMQQLLTGKIRVKLPKGAK